MAKRRPPPLSQAVSENDSYTVSFNIQEGVFTKGDVEISESGIQKTDSDRIFVVNVDEIELGQIIGRGASSYVQLGVHSPTGTQLALKVINILNKDKRNQLLKEIQALYDADCPCLVSFHGAFLREGTISICLEYMDGGSLTNVINQLGEIPEHVLANITYQVLWGLGYLKYEKRVHRDIKPSNILINALGHVKLTDFGISAELRDSIAMCATFVGTFKYMSPERIKNERYSYACDIWSLGLVLIECATGRYPYGDDVVSTIDMIQAVLESPPPTLSEEHFSPEFCEFIQHCLQIDPRDRLPADVLLGSPWLSSHGAVSLEDAIANVKAWIDESS